MTALDELINVHLVLQGKGGVGKTTVAALLAQWLLESKGHPDGSVVAGAAVDAPDLVSCIDTDPMNQTFSAFAELKAKHIDVMVGQEISPRLFDEVIDIIMQRQAPAVVDSGASAFVAFAHYLLLNDIPSLLLELGRALVVHVVVVGGGDLQDTLHGLAALVEQFHHPTRFVVWLNPFLGPICHETRPFQEMQVYLDHRDRIAALVTLPQLHQDTFGRDFKAMLTARKTFRQAIGDKSLPIVQRQRLRMIREQIFSQLDHAAAERVL